MSNPARQRRRRRIGELIQHLEADHSTYVPRHPRPRLLRLRWRHRRLHASRFRHQHREAAATELQLSLVDESLRSPEQELPTGSFATGPVKRASNVDPHGDRPLEVLDPVTPAESVSILPDQLVADRGVEPARAEQPGREGQDGSVVTRRRPRTIRPDVLPHRPGGKQDEHDTRDEAQGQEREATVDLVDLTHQRVVVHADDADPDEADRRPDE